MGCSHSNIDEDSKSFNNENKSSNTSISNENSKNNFKARIINKKTSNETVNNQLITDKDILNKKNEITFLDEKININYLDIVDNNKLDNDIIQIIKEFMTNNNLIINNFFVIIENSFIIEKEEYSLSNIIIEKNIKIVKQNVNNYNNNESTSNIEEINNYNLVEQEIMKELSKNTLFKDIKLINNLDIDCMIHKFKIINKSFILKLYNYHEKQNQEIELYNSNMLNVVIFFSFKNTSEVNSLEEMFKKYINYSNNNNINNIDNLNIITICTDFYISEDNNSQYNTFKKIISKHNLSKYPLFLFNYDNNKNNISKYFVDKFNDSINNKYFIKANNNFIYEINNTSSIDFINLLNINSVISNNLKHQNKNVVNSLNMYSNKEILLHINKVFNELNNELKDKSLIDDNNNYFYYYISNSKIFDFKDNKFINSNFIMSSPLLFSLEKETSFVDNYLLPILNNNKLNKINKIVYRNKKESYVETIKKYSNLFVKMKEEMNLSYLNYEIISDQIKLFHKNLYFKESKETNITINIKLTKNIINKDQCIIENIRKYLIESNININNNNYMNKSVQNINNYISYKRNSISINLNNGVKSYNTSKIDLTEVNKNSNNKIRTSVPIQYVNFEPDILEEFDSKYTKPKISIIFYTTEDEDVLNRLNIFFKKLNDFDNKHNTNESFHKILFRRMDSKCCVNLSNNNNKIPDFINEYATSNNIKVIKLPKKLELINIQNLFKEYLIILTNTKNEIIYSGSGSDIDLEKTLLNILEENNNIIYNKNYPILNDTKKSDCFNKRIKKKILHIVEFISLWLDNYNNNNTIDSSCFKSKFNYNKNDKSLKGGIYQYIKDRIILNTNYNYIYKPFIEFNYKKIYQFNEKDKLNCFLKDFKFSITVKDIHKGLLETEQIKELEHFIINETNGQFIFDYSTITINLNLKLLKNKTINNKLNCTKCDKEINFSFSHTNESNINYNDCLYYDYLNQQIFCINCETIINNLQSLIVHPNNLVYIYANKYDKINKEYTVLKEVIELNTVDKYPNSEQLLDEEDDINCGICNEILKGDNIVWLSLIHFNNYDNKNENLIICNRKCFSIIINRDYNLFDLNEIKRINYNCIDLENLVFKKIVLPLTGY